MSEQVEKKPRKDRDESGKFVKGHKVPSPRTGRPKRTGNNMSILAAVSQEAYTAEELVQMIHETYNMAREKEEWKGMYTVIAFIVSYAVGKPVQRSLSATIDKDEVRRILSGFGGQDETNPADADDDDVVDVDGTAV